MNGGRKNIEKVGRVVVISIAEKKHYSISTINFCLLASQALMDSILRVTWCVKSRGTISYFNSNISRVSRKDIGSKERERKENYSKDSFWELYIYI